MGSFGGRLQREREMRGISLDEIAEATKIGTRSLHALETEDFDKLPGGIFNKGFVRAYAKYLGIDEEQAVSDYMAAIGESRDEGEEKSVDTLKAVAAAKEAAAEAEGKSDSGSSALVVAVLALLLIVAAGIGGWEYFLRSRANSEPAPSETRVASPPPAAQPPVATTQPTPAATPATSPAKPDARSALKLPPPAPSVKPAANSTTGADAAQGPSFELLIRAREDSWMSIVADGKEVMSGTLKAATEKSVRARDRVVLKIGNAGGVEISHNGKTMAPLGDPGQSRTVTFTPSGLQQ